MPFFGEVSGSHFKASPWSVRVPGVESATWNSHTSERDICFRSLFSHGLVTSFGGGHGSSCALDIDLLSKKRSPKTKDLQMARNGLMV